MVKITNGINVFEVTSGAYDSIYSKQGYRLMEEKQTAPEAPKAPVKSEDELFLDAIIEKPISQWNKDEVKRFATLQDIDIAGTKNVNEAKALIKDYLEAQEADEE